MTFSGIAVHVQFQKSPFLYSTVDVTSLPSAATDWHNLLLLNRDDLMVTHVQRIDWSSRSAKKDTEGGGGGMCQHFQFSSPEPLIQINPLLHIKEPKTAKEKHLTTKWFIKYKHMHWCNLAKETKTYFMVYSYPNIITICCHICIYSTLHIMTILSFKQTESFRESKHSREEHGSKKKDCQLKMLCWPKMQARKHLQNSLCLISSIFKVGFPLIYKSHFINRLVFHKTEWFCNFESEGFIRKFQSKQNRFTVILNLCKRKIGEIMWPLIWGWFLK